MPKRMDPAEKRGEQLLIRLTAEELGWLESAAHLDRVTTSSYVYRLLQAHVVSLHRNNYVRADVENRRAYDEASGRTLALPTARAQDSDDSHGRAATGTDEDGS